MPVCKMGFEEISYIVFGFQHFRRAFHGAGARTRKAFGPRKGLKNKDYRRVCRDEEHEGHGGGRLGGESCK